MQNSEINFNIKNRLHDLLCKLISVKTIWGIVVTVIFLTLGTSIELTASLWLMFIGSLIGLNSIDKAVRKFSNNKTIVGNEPD